MKTTVKFLMPILFFSIFFTSCEGEDGAIGPAGQDGIDGIDGIDGVNGNANIIVSDWFTTNFGTTPAAFAFFDITDQLISIENTGNASIQAFGKSGDIISSIPITGVNQSYYFSIDPVNNVIRFAANTLDGTNTVFSAFNEVRFVIIPAVNPITQSAIDFTDYQSLKVHYDLTD